MRSPEDVLWIIIHGEKAGGYTTLLSQKEVDHALAVARNVGPWSNPWVTYRRKETEDEQDTKGNDR